jgi:hypothetical protein
MSESEIIVGPWGEEEYDMSDDTPEFASAVEELIATHTEETLGMTIAGVLEFLTIQAVVNGPYYITTEDKQALTVVAANEDAEALISVLPSNFKSWDDEDEPTFISDADPGDEQDEPASEQE